MIETSTKTIQEARKQHLPIGAPTNNEGYVGCRFENGKLTEYKFFNNEIASMMWCLEKSQ